MTSALGSTFLALVLVSILAYGLMPRKAAVRIPAVFRSIRRRRRHPAD